MQRIECLSSKLLARRWGLSPSTLERWRHKRKGPPHLKIGGRVRYRLQDIEDFEAARVAHAEAERRQA
jgi:predicted DNA-binding transcriptional regulator AlpA